MSYLLDKKIKKKKFFYTIFFIIVLLILFYFRLGILNGLAAFSHTILRPVLVFGNNIGRELNNASSYFIFKSFLLKENEDLKSKLSEQEVRNANYNSILAENISLKEILGRKVEKNNIILAAILSKPNQSPYDTLIIDVGAKQGLQVGDIVFALGNVPIGRIYMVYSNSSKVVLFSNGGEKTQALLSGKNIFLEIVGRGGGNFEMVIPRDLTLSKGDEVVLPGIVPYVLGIVETIISDPRDSFIKALLVSPVNIQELKFVEVESKR